MAKRDPEKTARNKIIKKLTSDLKDIEDDVLVATDFHNVLSLNSKIGSKHDQFIDIQNEVIHSPEHFISLYLEGYQNHLEKRWSTYESNLEVTWELLKTHKIFRDYLSIFLKRTYLRNYEALSKKRPNISESEIWIGQENANYGLLITPRFVNNQWENDKSEIRHFKPKYWSIGHVLATGLLIPDRNERIDFKTVKDYLNFFSNVIVRNSGSNYEREIADAYSEFVLNSADPLSIPLLIPEFRYLGREKKHKYRLDFTIIDSLDFNKIGFELSPWSTHGYLKKINGLSQKSINQMASDNFEKEMKKHKDFFRKHGVFALIYTDSDLSNIKNVFEDIVSYLKVKYMGSQLKFHIMDDFFK